MIKFKIKQINIILLVLALFIPSSSFSYLYSFDSFDNWKTLESIHFKIRFKDGMEKCAFITAKISEDRYVESVDFFQTELNSTIDIIIYPNNFNNKKSNKNKKYQRNIIVFFNGSYSRLSKDISKKLSYLILNDILQKNINGKSLFNFSTKNLPKFFIDELSIYLTINRKKREGKFLYYLTKKFGNIIKPLLNEISNSGNFEKAFKTITGNGYYSLRKRWEETILSNSSVIKNSIKINNSIFHLQKNYTIKNISRIDYKRNSCLLYLNNRVKAVKIPLYNFTNLILSKSKKYLIFTSSNYESSDIYLLIIDTNEIIKVTDDLYFESEIYFNKTEDKIIYLSNKDSEYYDSQINNKYSIDLTGKNIPIRSFINNGVEKKRDGYFSLSDIKFGKDRLSLNLDYILLHSSYLQDWGFYNSIGMNIYDDRERHRMFLNASYIYSTDKNSPNLDLAYYFTKYNIVPGGGFFYKNNLSNISFPDQEKSLLNNPHNSLMMNYYYGLFVNLSYFFTKNVKTSILIETGSFSKNNFEENEDIETKGSVVKSGIVTSYMNIYYKDSIPKKGFSGNIYLNQYNDFYNKTSATEFYYHLTGYFSLFDDLYIKAETAGGKIFSSNSDKYQYKLDSFTFLKGHSSFSYYGENFYSTSFEFTLKFFNWQNYNIPLFISSGRLSLYLFLNSAFIWIEDFAFINSKGEFDDFKMDMGSGLRMDILPGAVFKIDTSWPFYKNRFGNLKLNFSASIKF